jgi:triosephosphate isomerase
MEKLIVANWKMNPQSLIEAKELFNSIKNWIKRHSNMGPSRRLGRHPPSSLPLRGPLGWCAGRSLQNIRIIICPPFVYLSNFAPLTSDFQRRTSIIFLGAQDLFWEEKGSFTGEISPKMLKNLGVEYVIVGHSERRQILGESDEMINKKLKAAIKSKLKPIFCIGETEKERKSDKTFQVLKNQIKKALKSTSNVKLQTSNLIIAYEPVWAIGTGNPCKPEKAKEVLTFLRKLTQPLFHSTTQPLILYGGSVNSKIAKDYIKFGFDGLLVGGASLDSKEFIEIIKSIAKC